MVEIDRPPEKVFDYATDASLWHTWHPATASVSNVRAGPLAVGESVHEDIRVGPWKFAATWVVVESERPSHWAIETETPDGVSRIDYNVQPHGTGSRFTRVLAFRSKVYPWKALDTTLLRWMLTPQSRRALDQLKRVTEA